MAHGNAKYAEWITPEGLLKIGGWVRDGATDAMVAHNIGVSRGTLSDWKNRFTELADTMKREKEVIDIQVENTLLKNALGYDYEEVQTFVSKNERGEEVRRVKKIKKHMKPDTTAQIFWLKNRKPAEWRDNKNIEIGASVRDSEKKIAKLLESDEN